MKISELVTRLQGIAEDIGDVEVELDDGGGMSDPIQRVDTGHPYGGNVHVVLSPYDPV